MEGRRPGPPADWAKTGRTSKDQVGPAGGTLGGPAPQT
jgi:cell division protease FtsH